MASSASDSARRASSLGWPLGKDAKRRERGEGTRRERVARAARAANTSPIFRCFDQRALGGGGAFGEFRGGNVRARGREARERPGDEENAFGVSEGADFERFVDPPAAAASETLEMTSTGTRAAGSSAIWRTCESIRKNCAAAPSSLRS